MDTLFGIPLPLFYGQLLLGLINGAFYAMLSLGLSVIFGLLGIVNLVHGALFMTGAFTAWILLDTFGLGFWWSLALAPLIVGAFGIIIERLLLRHLYGLDHMYGLVLTLGLALVIEGTFRNKYGSGGLAYQIPDALRGATNLGFIVLPYYRGAVVGISLVVCLLTWALIEKTRLGARLRAAINVPVLVTLTYGAGVALAACAGVLAAPIYSVNPQMGANLIIVVFAIVVIGGMGSIMGSILSGFGFGVIEALTKVFYPQASSTVIFLCMVAVLLFRPSGLFGRRS
jgi:branched-chain amino acid transport system permease protein